MCSIYAAEIAPPAARGRLVGLVQFNIVLGILLAYGSNAIIAAIAPHDVAWRWMFGVMAVPAVIFLLLLATVPETLAGCCPSAATRTARPVSCAYKRFRRRPGAFKVDFAVESGVPWTNPAAGRRRHGQCRGRVRRTRRRQSRSACRTHAGAAVRRGWSAVPGRPATLHGQHSSGVDVSLTYRTAIPGDATAAIIGQIEAGPGRSLPGQDRRADPSGTTTQIAAYNPNFLGATS